MQTSRSESTEKDGRRCHCLEASRLPPSRAVSEAPAACEGLLPHRRPVTADDLISLHNGGRVRQQSQPAAHPPPFALLFRIKIHP